MPGMVTESFPANLGVISTLQLTDDFFIRLQHD
jgi:hypothetical protein